MLPKFSYTYFSILLYSIQFCKIINFIPSCFDHDHLRNISIPGWLSYFEKIFNPGFQSTYGFPKAQDMILTQCSRSVCKHIYEALITLTLVGVVVPRCCTPSLFRLVAEVPQKLAPLPSERKRDGVEGAVPGVWLWPFPLPIPPDQLSVDTFRPSVAAYLHG